MNRPIVLKLAIPNHPALENYIPPAPLDQSPFRADAFWMLDGDTNNYKLTNADFWLVFVPNDEDTGNWCIAHRNYTGLIPTMQPLHIPKIVNKNESPGEAISSECWEVNIFGFIGETTAPVSCQPLTEDDIGRMLESTYSYSTRNALAIKSPDLGFLFQESMGRQHGRAILPWFKASLATLPGLLHDASQPLDIKRWKCIAYQFFFVQLLEINEDSPLSAFSENSTVLAHDLLLLHHDRVGISKETHNTGVIVLGILCSKQAAWKSLLVQECPDKVLELLLVMILDPITRRYAARLFQMVLDSFEAVSFNALPSGLLEDAAATVVQNMENDKDLCKLFHSMGNNQCTRKILARAKSTQERQGTWAESLSEAQIVYLNDECRPPNRFLCEISMQIMIDPVVLVPSGEFYDRSCIAQSMHHRDIDPHSNVALGGNHQLVALKPLAREICEWTKARLRESPNVDQASDTFFDALMFP
ncbi:MAG: hypothetical protein SGBAC_009386 [Bacillariaceae sp.]